MADFPGLLALPLPAVPLLDDAAVCRLASGISDSRVTAASFAFNTAISQPSCSGFELEMVGIRIFIDALADAQGPVIFTATSVMVT